MHALVQKILRPFNVQDPGKFNYEPESARQSISLNNKNMTSNVQSHNN